MNGMTTASPKTASERMNFGASVTTDKGGAMKFDDFDPRNPYTTSRDKWEAEMERQAEVAKNRTETPVETNPFEEHK